jgi:hypothetical protein
MLGPSDMLHLYHPGDFVHLDYRSSTEPSIPPKKTIKHLPVMATAVGCSSQPLPRAAHMTLARRACTKLVGPARCTWVTHACPALSLAAYAASW